MAASSGKKWSDMLTCRQVLNIMVIIGFMLNYMLRVNLTIAIVDMIASNSSNTTNTTSNSTEPVVTLADVTRFDWTEAMKNEILGSFFWGYILTELPGGRLAEVVGARRVFGGGMLAASVLTILTPFACYMNYYVVLVSRALVGFFLGATWPAMPPMAAKWIPPLERSKFIANMMASALGGTLTLPLCGYIISSVGWPSVFYVTGTICLVWSILWFLIIHDSPAQHPRITPEERFEIESAIAAGASGKSKKPTRVPWMKIFTSAPVWAIVVTHTCSVYGYFTVLNQLPSYMTNVLHFNIKANGLLSSLPFLGKYVMAVMASYLADRILKAGKLSITATRKAFTSFAIFIPCFLMTIQAIWGINQGLSVTIFTATLFFNGAVTAGYLSNGLDIAPNFSGTIFGMANTMSSIGGWVSTKIVGLLTTKESTFEEWRFVFWMLVGTYFTGAVVYLFFGTGKMQAWNFGDDYVDPEKVQEMKPLNGSAVQNLSEKEKEKEILA